MHLDKLVLQDLASLLLPRDPREETSDGRRALEHSGAGLEDKTKVHLAPANEQSLAKESDCCVPRTACWVVCPAVDVR